MIEKMTLDGKPVAFTVTRRYEPPLHQISIEVLEDPMIDISDIVSGFTRDKIEAMIEDLTDDLQREAIDAFGRSLPGESLFSRYKRPLCLNLVELTRP